MVTSKKILITGASGFVGRQILKALMVDKHDISVIVRDKEGKNIPPGVNILETEDLFDESYVRLTEILKSQDILIHSAWYTEPGKYLTSPLNLHCLTGTLKLAQAFGEMGGKRFIGIGTCFEYDLNRGILSVQTPLNPTTLYAACKVSVFQVLNQLLPALGVEFLWCRLFYVYGENEDPRRLVPYLKEQLKSGQPADLSSGNQIRDFINVQEAGQMIADYSLSSREGSINICSGVPITVRQFAEQIADQFGRRDLLNFGARPDNLVDPPCVVGLLQ